jgi:hypothetical protein
MIYVFSAFFCPFIFFHLKIFGLFNFPISKHSALYFSVVLLWAEFERSESFWAKNIGFWQFGPNNQKGRMLFGRNERVRVEVYLSWFRPFLSK